MEEHFKPGEEDKQHLLADDSIIEEETKVELSHNILCDSAPILHRTGGFIYIGKDKGDGKKGQEFQA